MAAKSLLRPLGWWAAADPSLESNERDDDARYACRFAYDCDCPYPREAFDCADCVIEDARVVPVM